MSFSINEGNLLSGMVVPADQKFYQTKMYETGKLFLAQYGCVSYCEDSPINIIIILYNF